MKKLLVSLVTLCLAFCGITAMADGTADDVISISDLSELSTSKVYLLTTKRATLAAGDEALGTNTSVSKENTAEQFAVLKSSYSDYYYLYSVSQAKFVTSSKAWVEGNAISDNTVAFKISSTGNSTYPFHFTASNGDHINIDQSAALYINYWSTIDDGNSFKIAEAADLSADVQAAVQKAADYADLRLFLGNYVTAYSNAGSTDEAYTTFSTVYQSSYSTATTDYASWSSDAVKEAFATFKSSFGSFITDGANVVLGNKGRSDWYVYARTDNTLGALGSKDTPRYLWTLKKQADGTVKFYNEYTNKWVGGIPSGNDVRLSLVDSEDGAQGYLAIQSGDYVCFVDPAFSLTNRNAVHMANWDGIVRWDNASSTTPSYFKFVEGDDLNTILTSWTTSIKTSVEDSNGSYLGDVNATAKDLTDALTVLSSATVSNYVAAYKNVETAISNATITPETDAYYTIEVARCDNASSYIGHILAEGYNDTENTSGSNALIHEKTPANIVPALWQFEATSTSGQYNIKAVNSGSYISKTSGASTYLSLVGSDSDNKGTYTYGKSSVDVAHAVSLKDVSASSHSLISVRNEDEHVVSWDAGNDGSGNNFKIKAVTEIPVTISDAGYATLNLPFAVTIPTGVEAYTGTKGDGVITLTKVEDGIIPAYLPVILVASADTYKFPYYGGLYSTEATGLTGTLTPVTIGDKEAAYILKNGTNGVGMYKITSKTDRTIPANKAYVAGGTDGNANVLVFNFGETTGIHSAATSANGKADTYYDLNGRQVLYPAHGVFVKGNGQKVFIK